MRPTFFFTPTATPPPRAVFLLLALVVSLAGCVERRLTIRSNPPGAKVYVDNNEIGTTPASARFVYYGTRDIRLVRDGYETLTVQHTVNPPFYQLTPLDFITENLVPFEIRDERTVDFQLQPMIVTPTSDLLHRGEELRQRTGHRHAPVAPPTIAPNTVTSPTPFPPRGATPLNGDNAIITEPFPQPPPIRRLPGEG